MRHATRWTAIFWMLLAVTGCGHPMWKPHMEPYPDAPILITNTFGGRVQGAIYDADQNQLVPCGWFNLSDYDGWTLHKFDWSKRIESDE